MATLINSPQNKTNKSRFFGEGLAFDDVLLLPAYSQVLPREVNIQSHLTKSLTLNVPILSAAMDTVTEAGLAIALAREGGLGILHKNMSIEKQAEQVRKVKRSESGLIVDPITLHDDATIGDALRLMKENKIGGIPIVDNNNKLAGVLTNRDLRFETDKHKKVKEVMTKENLITAPEGTDLKKAEKILHQYKIEKLPVVNKQGKLIGLITYRDILQIRNFPNAVKDSMGRLVVGAALGITKDLLDRAAALQKVGVDIVTLDSAHGHSKGVLGAVKNLKKNFKNLQVIAGNVGTAQGAKAMAEAGADAVKVGIGPGSICTTRIVTGAGVPQLTAIMEGMGSIGAMQQGSGDRYFQDVEDDLKKLVPEGIEGRVAYKGNLSEVIAQFVGGLRSGMGYCGAKDIDALQQATFVKITNAGMRESHTHDVEITKEAPNYSRR